MTNIYVGKEIARRHNVYCSRHDSPVGKLKKKRRALIHTAVGYSTNRIFDGERSVIHGSTESIVYTDCGTEDLWSPSKTVLRQLIDDNP